MADVAFGEFDDLSQRKRSKRKVRNSGEMSTEGLRELQPVSLQYESVEAIFNHENLWVHKINTNPVSWFPDARSTRIHTNPLESKRLVGC